MCRSRRELSNEYLLANIGVDTAENELLKSLGLIQFICSFALLGAETIKDIAGVDPEDFESALRAAEVANLEEPGGAARSLSPIEKGKARQLFHIARACYGIKLDLF